MLERLFPDDHSMPLVNALLAKCVVREEKDCIATALNLRFEVEALIDQIRSRRGQRPNGADRWSCRMCGQGMYQPAAAPPGTRFGPPMMLAQLSGGDLGDRQAYRIFVCDNDQCRHVELFG